MTAAFLSTLLILGIVGFFAGYVAAGSELERQAHTDPSASPSASKPSPSASPVRPSPTPVDTGTPTGTPTRADAFDMPDLVNKNFRDARNDALGRKLGVNLVFNERSIRADGTVVRTNPVAGFKVFPGLTIQLYVAGPPPVTTVPEVLDKPCDEAKTMILDAGFKITSYPSGERGKVKQTEPAPGTAGRWNDGVKIFCA